MMKQSFWIASQTLRALMRSGSWKILALLPVGVFASPAFAGPVTWLLPQNYPATISWIIQQAQDGSVVSGTSGVTTSPATDLPFWLALVDNNNVIAIPNPSGLGIAQVNIEIPSVDASAPSVAPSNGQQFANSTLVLVGFEDYVQIVGPPSQAPLQLLWAGNYSLSGATTNQINVTEAVGRFAETWSCADGCSSGAFTGSLNVRPGQIVLTSKAASAYSQDGGPTGVAYLDPYFYLSPAEVAEGYSLEFSEFVGNTPPASVSGSAVPEPGSLMLFGTGVIAAGIARRRRAARR